MSSMESIKSYLHKATNEVEMHPFVNIAKSGGLDFSGVIRWIFCAGHESKNFPAILGNLISNQSDPNVIRILQENLNDELGNGNIENAHFNHYLHLLRDLGIQEVEFTKYNIGQGVKTALVVGDRVSSQKNSNVALGYFLVNEGMTPIIYSALKESVRNNSSNVSLKFFDLHIESDVLHVNKLFDALAHLFSKHATNGIDQLSSDIKFGIDLGLRAMQLLLDEALGVFDSQYIKLH